MEIEFSEEIEKEKITQGAASQALRLEIVTPSNLTSGLAANSSTGTLSSAAQALTVESVIPITAVFPVEEGRQARQRVRVTPQSAPAPGDQVRLVLEASAVADLFKNSMASTYELVFTWPSPPAQTIGAPPASSMRQASGFTTTGLEVLDDTASPYVEEAYVDEGILVLEFSEPPGLANATAAITLDGATLTWAQDATGYRLTSTAPLATGSHTLTIGTGPLDLSDQGLEEIFTQTFTLGASAVTTASPSLTAATAAATTTQSRQLYDRPQPTEVTFPALANPFGYHGRQHDFETGLIYFRNRYYDPKLGRFITADPLGYVDGPSQYGFAGNDPVNFGDPLGLQALPLPQTPIQPIQPVPNSPALLAG